jgi:chromosome segregation ATPase
MKIFNPKEAPELERLRKENEDLRNTLHKVLSKQETSTDLEKKISDMTERLSEMAKEEQRIEDFLKNTTDDKVEKSKAVFELNKQIGELTQTKEQLEENIASIEQKKELLLKLGQGNMELQQQQQLL